MKQPMQILLRIVGSLLSPTRAMFQFFKPVEKNNAETFIWRWNNFFLYFATAIWFLLLVIDVDEWRIPWLFPMFLWLLPLSRATEIFYAFLKDGLDRLKGEPAESGLSPHDRIVLILLSYIEVIVNFAILYYLGFRDAFSHRFRDVVEAGYFSAITITTVGYGDLAPCEPWSQLLVVYEVIGGMLMIVLALGTYLDKAAPGNGDN